jgi:hypothetical protein
MQKTTISTKRNTTSVTKKERIKPKTLAKQEQRHLNRQIFYMMEFYEELSKR